MASYNGKMAASRRVRHMARHLAGALRDPPTLGTPSYLPASVDILQIDSDRALCPSSGCIRAYSLAISPYIQHLDSHSAQDLQLRIL